LNLRRFLLLSAYKALKITRLILFRNNSFNHANILLFHRIRDNDDSPLSTPSRVFESMICEISQGYNPVSLEVLVRKIRKREELEPRSVVVTFDDGYRDNFLIAAPILQKYGVPATFFISSEYIDSERVFSWDENSKLDHPLMTWNEVRGLVKMGFDIGCHTANHYDLGQVNAEVATEEIFSSKKRIENEIGKNVTLFSFPFGRRACMRTEYKEIVKEAGFDCCCSAYGGKVNNSSDLYGLHRLSAYPSTIELLMELDGFMTYFDGNMRLNYAGFKISF